MSANMVLPRRIEMCGAERRKGAHADASNEANETGGQAHIKEEEDEEGATPLKHSLVRLQADSHE